MINDTLVFNGIDGRTGAYLRPSVDVAQLARTLEPRVAYALEAR